MCTDPTIEPRDEPATPNFLDEGGPLATALHSTRGAAMAIPSAWTLHQALTRNAESLRDPSQAFFGERSEDAVLQLVAIAARDGEIPRTLRTHAFQAYSDQPDDYDLILRNLIPEDFRRWAREGIARRNYFLNANSTAAGDWDVFSSTLTESAQDHLLGLATGLSNLDEMLGGLHGLTLVGGDKGVGKTSLSLQVAWAAMHREPDLGVLFYMLDTPKQKVYERMLCLEARVDYRYLHRNDNSPEVAERIAQANSNLQSSLARRMRIQQRTFGYTIDEYREDATPQRQGITAHSVLSDCNQLMRASGVQQILLVFDLFQKMDPSGEIADNAARDHYRLDVFSEVINESASVRQPCGFPILVTSEIRKDAGRSELTRDDLKGDGRMASDADVVLLMWPEAGATNSPIVPTNLRVDKGREGVIRGDIQLWFEHQQFRFHETNPSVAPDAESSSAEPTSASIDPLAE